MFDDILSGFTWIISDNLSKRIVDILMVIWYNRLLLYLIAHRYVIWYYVSVYTCRNFLGEDEWKKLCQRQPFYEIHIHMHIYIYVYKICVCVVVYECVCVRWRRQVHFKPGFLCLVCCRYVELFMPLNNKYVVLYIFLSNFDICITLFPRRFFWLLHMNLHIWMK